MLLHADMSFSLVDAFPIVSMMPMLYSSATSLGFQDGNIYDVPKMSASKDSATYDARSITFQVDCRAIKNVKQTGDPSVTTSVDQTAQVVTYPFFIHDDLQDVHVTPGKHLL